MTWRSFKRGIIVEGLRGMLTGLIGINLGIPIKAAVWFIVGSTAKDILLWLNKATPAGEDLGDTQIIKKSDICPPGPGS